MPRSVPERTGSKPPVTPPESPFPRRVAVETVDDRPLRESFGVAVEVSVPDAEVVAGDTAHVELALRTTGETDRSLTYTQVDCARNYFRAKNGEFWMALLPAGPREWTVEDDGCPVSRNIDCDMPAVEEPITVPASDSLRWRYDVVVSALNLARGGCLVPGSYRFYRSFTGGESKAVLSFTLSVTSS